MLEESSLHSRAPANSANWPIENWKR